MKYWLYFLAKLLVGTFVIWGLVLLLKQVYPVHTVPLVRNGLSLPTHLNNIYFTYAAFLGIWLIGAGLFSLIVRDQRRRCRTCLRRLIMPIARGSWGNMVVFGRPKTEWICPFGHGTLTIENLQITGRQSPDWHPHDDNIWKELESSHQGRK